MRREIWRCLPLREGDAFGIGATYGAPPAYADFLRREPMRRPVPGAARWPRRSDQAGGPGCRSSERRKGYSGCGPMRVGPVERARRSIRLVAVPMLKDDEHDRDHRHADRQVVRPFTDQQMELRREAARAQAVMAIGECATGGMRPCASARMTCPKFVGAADRHGRCAQGRGADGPSTCKTVLDTLVEFRRLGYARPTARRCASPEGKRLRVCLQATATRRIFSGALPGSCDSSRSGDPCSGELSLTAKPFMSRM